MKKFQILRIAIFIFHIILFNTVFALPVGLFDGHSDFGANVKPGSAIFIASTSQYVISGAGYNVWADHDEFQYVWKKIKGDFILYALAEFLSSWVDYHRKVGWIVRKSLDGKGTPKVQAYL
jgi:hypothetical protein